MHRQRPPPLPLFAFALLSLALHVAAAGALGRAAARSAPPRASSEHPQATPALAGDTLDVERDEPADTDEPAEPGVTESAAVAHAGSAAAHGPGAGGTPRVRTRPSAPATAPAPAALFGAVGERSAVDLATSFTRAFPQAASADPIWPTVAFGSAGAAEVSLLLDDEGHLVEHTVSGSPSLALRRSIEHTIGLLGARPFTSRGNVTRLRITAHVSRNDVHDGLHGDFFALSGGSFTGDVGTAFFALPAPSGGGRRVDVELKLLGGP